MEGPSHSPQQNQEKPWQIERHELLTAFCEKHNLTIIKETVLQDVFAFVVLGGFENKEEVCIGYPGGKKHGLAATDRIAGVKMGMNGHGHWRRSILE